MAFFLDFSDLGLKYSYDENFSYDAVDVVAVVVDCLCSINFDLHYQVL